MNKILRKKIYVIINIIFFCILCKIIVSLLCNIYSLIELEIKKTSSLLAFEHTCPKHRNGEAIELLN